MLQSMKLQRIRHNRVTEQQTALYPKNSSPVTPPTIHLWKFLFKWFSLDSSLEIFNDHLMQARHFVYVPTECYLRLYFPHYIVIVFTCFTHQTVNPLEALQLILTCISPAYPSFGKWGNDLLGSRILGSRTHTQVQPILTTLFFNRRLITSSTGSLLKSNYDSKINTYYYHY